MMWAVVDNANGAVYGVFHLRMCATSFREKGIYPPNASPILVPVALVGSIVQGQDREEFRR